MNTFTVIEVLKNDMIRVSPDWILSRGENDEGITGNSIKVVGLNNIGEQFKDNVISRLTTLILNKEVSIVNPFIVEDPNNNTPVVAGNVLIDDTDVLYYFPEYTHNVSNDNLIEQPSC